MFTLQITVSILGAVRNLARVLSSIVLGCIVREKECGETILAKVGTVVGGTRIYSGSKSGRSLAL